MFNSKCNLKKKINHYFYIIKWVNNAGTLKNKTMDDKLMYNTPNITPTVDLNY